jgi:hypothetical protein
MELNHRWTRVSGAATKTEIAAKERIDRKELDRGFRGLHGFQTGAEKRELRGDRIMTGQNDKRTAGRGISAA